MQINDAIDYVVEGYSEEDVVDALLESDDDSRKHSLGQRGLIATRLPRLGLTGTLAAGGGMAGDVQGWKSANKKIKRLEKEGKVLSDAEKAKIFRNRRLVGSSLGALAGGTVGHLTGKGIVRGILGK